MAIPGTDPGAAHTLTGQMASVGITRRQIQLFGRQLADDFQRTFFAGAMNAAFGIPALIPTLIALLYR